MNDRELLEMSAKACGIEIATWSNCQAGGFQTQEGARGKFWNPLVDDGDAMRLSSRLYLDVCFYRGFEEVIVQGERTKDTPNSLGEILEVREPFGIYIASATRRAIVRASAEIGRNMK